MSSLELLQKAGRVLRQQGPAGLARAAVKYAKPPRAGLWPAAAEAMDGRRIIEVGGPSKVFSKQGILPVYPIAAGVDNCIFAATTLWAEGIAPGKTYQYSKGRPPGNQYLGEAGKLSSLVDARYQGLISSHAIEHLANPIAALIDWKNALGDDGIMLLVIPHKDGTFDHRRPTTRIEHLIEDYERDTAEDDLTHLDEILALHDFDRDPGATTLEGFRARALDNYRVRGLHHHVFDAMLAAELLDYCNYQIMALEALAPLHIVAMAHNPPSGGRADNSAYLRPDAAYLRDSPFHSDRQRMKEAGTIQASVTERRGVE